MISKKRYIQAFGLCVIALAVVRAVFPSVADDTKANNIGVIKNDSTDSSTIVAEVEERKRVKMLRMAQTAKPMRLLTARAKRLLTES